MDIELAPGAPVFEDGWEGWFQILAPLAVVVGSIALAVFLIIWVAIRIYKEVRKD